VRASLPLRGRILIFTVLPIAALTFATLWVVNRNITHQTEQGIHDDLHRASAIIENVLNGRARALALAGGVVVRDPKFFSVLTLPGNWHDAELQATVAGVARDFNSITQADLFEVVDVQGHVLASVGHEASDAAAVANMVAAALRGNPVSGIMAGRGTLDQVYVAPVHAGGRVIGALLLGSEINAALAGELQRLTRSQVSFYAPGSVLASTLQRPSDRQAMTRAILALGDLTDALPEHGMLLDVRNDGQTLLTLIGRLPLSLEGEGQVFVMQRSLEEETAFLRAMQVGLMELGGLALVIALAAGLLVAHRITSPVSQLVRGAEEMERGNYAYPVEVRSADEIGYLAERFRDMREKQRTLVSNLAEVARVRSEFISVASHELRTPISVIRGFEELMEAGALGPVTSDQHEALTAIRGSVGTLSRIAEDATRMSHIEGSGLQLSPSECDLRQRVLEAVEAARADGPGRRVTVEVDAPRDLGTAVIDGTRFGVAVANLVRNAIRFTPDHGRVEVRARRGEGTLEVAVSDNGVGIEPERQQHLFDRSFMVRDSLHHHSSSRLEFNSAGLGMGLSIAAGIIQAHRGSLLVESTPGVGSVFTVMIPLPTAKQQEAA
jgi:signal transduction histidine kinase/flavin-binding protein dodecin